ncbi:MAG: TldD/PmbA family protein [Tissierellaceae bacterium]|nr:TldD/PmbA family protein [Tissierellaceae bacterium]
MNYREFLNRLINKGQEKMDDVEAFLVKNKELVIEIYKGEIDKYSIAESGGLSLRGTSNGKMGYSYTEKIEDDSIDMLVDDALENSKYIEGSSDEIIFSGSDNYENINHYNDSLNQVPIQDKIDFLINLEKEASQLDDRVFAVNACAYEEFEGERYIVNSKGIDLHDKSNGGATYISVVVKENDDTKTGLSYRIFSDFSTLDYKEIAKEAVENATTMLGAKNVKSDNYPVIFENTTFASLLSAFTPIFSADNVQKGLSLLKGKIGEEIAVPILSIVDDPFLKDGFASRNFDDEGTASTFNNIIDNGKLVNLAYNWKTANKDGTSSTGHASRSYKGSINTAPTNLYVINGDMEIAELMNLADNGLYINNLEGLHSGLNAVSGDFSLSASGYEIVNGQKTRPVNQITIAGNLYEVFKNIEAIGNDLKFGLPSNGYVGSPSILVNHLSVSGE